MTMAPAMKTARTIQLGFTVDTPFQRTDDSSSPLYAMRATRTVPDCTHCWTCTIWDMQVREHDVPEAVATARTLAHDFPDNAELRRFLADHDPTASRIAGPAAP